MSDLERELESGQSRKMYDRDEFQATDDNKKNPEVDESKERVALGPARPSSVLGEKLFSAPEKKKKTKSSKISGSFMPGVCEISGQTKVNLNEDLIVAREKLFCAVLKESGFEMVTDVANECCARTRSVFGWKISIKASASYEITLELDKDQVHAVTI